MKLINSAKKYNKVMNSNKNKLNSKIILIFNHNPKTLYLFSVFSISSMLEESPLFEHKTVFFHSKAHLFF